MNYNMTLQALIESYRKDNSIDKEEDLYLKLARKVRFELKN